MKPTFSCYYCGYKIFDANNNCKCPKCGEKRWQTELESLKEKLRRQAREWGNIKR